MSQKPLSRGETVPWRLGQDEGPGDHQGCQRRHQGAEDLDGVAPDQDQKGGHQGPGEQQQGLPEGGGGQGAGDPDPLDEGQGVTGQAGGHDPGAGAVVALPLGQEV